MNPAFVLFRPTAPRWPKTAQRWPKSADSGAMVGISGPTWVPAGTMLHFNGPTWGDAGLLTTSWVPTWTPCWISWGKLEGHVIEVSCKKECKKEHQRVVLDS